MFRAYEINLDDIESLIRDESKEPICIDKPNIPTIANLLENEVYTNREIFNGQLLLNKFFPHVECPVFLSHSGRDLDKVRQFAHWLRKKFEINAFIDSDLWEGIEKLQCSMRNGTNDKTIRPLEKETYESSGTHKYNIKEHIYVMLCHALTKTIDSAECFIFLNSSNSTTKDDPEKTFSPWIFYELATINTIKINQQRTFIDKTTPKDDKATPKIILEAINCEVLYPISPIQIHHLTNEKLIKWASAFEKREKKMSKQEKMSDTNFYNQAPIIMEKIMTDANASPQYKISKWAYALDWLYRNTSTEKRFSLQEMLRALLG